MSADDRAQAQPIAEPEAREQYYDDVLAPKLQEIADLCKAQGMPMVAAVYFHEDYSGITRIAPPDSVDHPAWWLMHHAWHARGNLDSMCMAIVKRVKEENDGSIATRVFRGGGRLKAAFFRGVADAAEQGAS